MIGEFERGDTVKIADASGSTLEELGKGTVLTVRDIEFVGAKARQRLAKAFDVNPDTITFLHFHGTEVGLYSFRVRHVVEA